MGKASILIDDHVKEDLDREASRVGASASSIAESAIGAYLKARTAKRDAIVEAVAEADEGMFVSREAMDRWVSSWGSETELAPPKADVFR